MTSLEYKRKQLELMRVRVARQELEFKIEERMDEIARIKEAIEKQISRELEIEADLNKQEGK